MSDAFVDGEDGVFAVIFEGKTQAPIMMETEACDSSYAAARARRDKLLKREDTIRVSIVRVENVGRYSSGNTALLHSMKEQQK